MSLRIIGGKFRNRPIKSPKGEQTRPTLAVVRKAVFDIMQQEIEDAHFLDLFAGSGAMGIEALSRGAKHATFIESHRNAIDSIKANLKDLQVEAEATLLGYDAILALKKLQKKQEQFDIVYIDPPYMAKNRLILELLSAFDEHPLLKTNGTIFIEEALPATSFPTYKHLELINSRTYSQTVLHQFCRREA